MKKNKNVNKGIMKTTRDFSLFQRIGKKVALLGIATALVFSVKVDKIDETYDMPNVIEPVGPCHPEQSDTSEEFQDEQTIDF